jgi:hypothetical protein
MKIKRTAPEVQRVEAIVEMAAALVEMGEQRQYSQSIEFTLMELVRDEMRATAQEESWLPNSDELLERAIHRVVQKVENAIGTRSVELDFAKYVRTLREKLDFPAREIQKLSERLTESRQTEKLGTKKTILSDSGNQLIVHELGLREATQGLLVESPEDRNEIDVDRLREQPGWRIEGEWFPYELFAEELIFVIDDDGSIFVSTVNLPLDVRHRADGLLRRVAELLYS